MLKNKKEKKKKKEKRKKSKIQTRATRLVKFPNIKCLLTWETGFPSSVTHLTQIFDCRETSDSDVNAVTPKHVRRSCIFYYRIPVWKIVILQLGEGGGMHALGAALVRWLKREEGRSKQKRKRSFFEGERRFRATNVRCASSICYGDGWTNERLRARNTRGC